MTNDQLQASLEAQLGDKRAKAHVLHEAYESLQMEIRALVNMLNGVKAAAEATKDAAE